jgi:copper(I)-binding protein
MKRLKMLAAVAVVACGASAGAGDYTRGDLVIEHPWTRPTPGGVKVGSGYLVIRNRGKRPDRLLSASTPIAGKVEVHQTIAKDGVMMMRQVEGGLALPPGKDVELKPAALHLMFFELKQPLQQGETFPATLVFENAGSVNVEFNVEAMSTTKPPRHGH